MRTGFLSRDQALGVLALTPGATASEIKEAYRDLVKVWHPDRFGNDSRLRRKAELQLAQINEAYRILQVHSNIPFPASPPVQPSRAGVRVPASRTPQDRYEGMNLGLEFRWFLGGTVVLLILLASYFAIGHGFQQTAPPPASSSSEALSPAVSPQPVKAHAEAGKFASGRLTGTSTSSKPASHGHNIRSLSAADTNRILGLCSRQKQEPEAYRACLKAQLLTMTDPTSTPDLSALDPSERASIESLCGDSGRTSGLRAYNRCANAQLAGLRAEPARPDLSELSDEDRAGIDSACAYVRRRSGPAAYNRCAAAFLHTLKEAAQ